MKIYLLFILLSTSFVTVPQKDWRQMKRHDISHKVENLKVKNGLNKIGEDWGGFTFYAVGEDDKLVGWEAKANAQTLKLSTHYYEPTLGDRKSSTNGDEKNAQVEVVCVDAKEVCFKTRIVAQ